MKFSFNLDKKDLIFGTIIVVLILLLFWCGISLLKTKDNLTISQHNIEALTDTVKYHKTKSGELMAEKLSLIGDMEVLKSANEKLAKDVEDMRIKKPTTVVYVETIVENEKHDTIFNDVECNETFNTTFDFSNEYRQLKGSIICDQILKLNIDTDIVNANYTIALEDNKVFVKSNNPYIRYNDITVLEVPEYEPTWCLVVGPSVSVGYDPFHQWYIGAGVSLTFGWNIKGIGKRVRK